MRAFAVLVLASFAVAGCGSSDDCRDNGEGTCPNNLVCARNSECLPQSEVRFVRVTWTIGGEPATESRCARQPELYLMFYGTAPADTFGFAPVPCQTGVFTIDRLPSRFVGVEIGVEGGFQMQKSFDAQGRAAFDLVP